MNEISGSVASSYLAISGALKNEFYLPILTDKSFIFDDMKLAELANNSFE